MKIKEEYIEFYFRQLYGLTEDYSELRLIPTKGSAVYTQFYKSPFNVKQPIDYLKNNHEINGIKNHCFASVNLRSRTRGKERFVSKVCAFAVDMDFKDYENGEEEARQIIDNFSLPPSFVVHSGNGFHCYYKLKEPYIVQHRGDIEEAKQVSVKLHRKLDGDSTYDLSRVLRIPGTYNVKNGDKTLCKFDSISFEKYKFEQLREVLPDGKVELNNGADLDLNTESDIETWQDIRNRIPNKLCQRIEQIPSRHQDDRSANDFHVAVKLLEQGFSDQEVLDSFKLFAKIGVDAGDKCSEEGERYLKKTVSSAKQEYNKWNKLANDLGNIDIVESE